jgi:hypothetical protein
MVGWKRWLYSIVGWEYDPLADEKQKHQKYLLTEQIKNTKDIQKILKQEIPPPPKILGEYSNHHYLNALTRPDTPCPNNNLILDKDGVIIDIHTGYTKIQNNNNKKKSRTRKRKRNKI